MLETQLLGSKTHEEMLWIATNAKDNYLSDCIADAWRDYLRRRTCIGRARELKLRNQLKKEVGEAYLHMRKRASSRRERLRFSEARLTFFAMKWFEQPCAFCCEPFGIENFGVAWAYEPTPIHPDPFRLTNVIVCCRLCAAGKGMVESKGTIKSDSFVCLMMCLSALPETEARRLRKALVRGKLLEDLRKGEKVLPRRRRQRVTRQPRDCPSDLRKK